MGIVAILAATLTIGCYGILLGEFFILGVGFIFPQSDWNICAAIIPRLSAITLQN